MELTLATKCSAWQKFKPAWSCSWYSSCCTSISVFWVKVQETITVAQNSVRWGSLEPLFLQSLQSATEDPHSGKPMFRITLGRTAPYRQSLERKSFLWRLISSSSFFWIKITDFLAASRWEDRSWERRACSALFNIRCSVHRKRDTWDLVLQIWLIICNTKDSLAARQYCHPTACMYRIGWVKSSYIQKRFGGRTAKLLSS